MSSTPVAATFTQHGHAYQVSGVAVPSVTQVLRLAGIDDVSRIPLHFLERARCVGELVHRACEFLDEESLDLASLDEPILGYVLGYQKFRAENCFQAEQIEYRTIGESWGMRYGLCVDRVGRFGEEMNSYVVDLKTSSKAGQGWGIQTAAYAQGLGKFGDYRRLVVHLSKEGKYKIIRYEDAHDLQLWNCALELATWRMEHGAKLEP